MNGKANGAGSYIGFRADPNPEHLFKDTPTKLLIRVCNRELNIKKLARRELLRRGIDRNNYIPLMDMEC